MKTLKYILAAIVLAFTTNGVAQTGAGFPDWPLIQRHSNNGLSNTISNQLVNYRPAFLVTPVSSPTQGLNTQTSKDFGPSAPAYDNCGNLAFYVKHTGDFLPTGGAGLKLVAPSGTDITIATGPMNGSPMDNEVQVFLMPGSSNQWMIIYNENFNPATGTFTVAKSRYLKVRYSIVSLNTGTGVFSYVSKDVELNNGTTTYYDYGKALSIEHYVNINNGFYIGNVRYLYLRRSNRASDQDPQSISSINFDQFTIGSSGFILSSGNPRVFTYGISKGFSSVEDFGAPLELNETGTEMKLAGMMCYNGTAGNSSTVGSKIFYTKFTDHETFNVPTAEIIQCSDLALIPSDNTGDTYNLSYHTAGWGGTYKAPKDFNNATLTLQTYLGNFHRGLYYLEFSPSGRFLYVGGGGYSVSGTTSITFLGQVDLSLKLSVNATNQYGLRLKVQEIAGQTLGANNYKYYGQGPTYTGITDANYIAWKGVSVMEKAPNAKIYFTKINSRTLFCLDDPDEVFTAIDFLPLNLLNSNASNLTLLSDPTYTTSNTISTILPDAVDQQNYTAQLAGCNTTVPCANCIGSFAPNADNTTVYQLSTWVSDADYTPGMRNFTDPVVYINFISTTGSTTSSGPYSASGQIIDQWQKVDAQFTVPVGTANIEVQLQCNTGNCYFDDIRIFPFDGSMKTYVYDPKTLRLAAELDERNYATYYEYDEEGKLVRIKKETEKGVMTIQESKTAVKKR